SDPELVNIMIDSSLATMIWLRSVGVRFIPAYHLQAFKVDGKFKFWGGLPVQVSGGGIGLMQALFEAAESRGIEVLYETRAVSLIEEEGVVRGVQARRNGSTISIRAGATVLASGGFEANAEWRTRYLGPGWDLAKVRGTRYNAGDGIRMAVEIGAM